MNPYATLHPVAESPQPVYPFRSLAEPAEATGMGLKMISGNVASNGFRDNAIDKCYRNLVNSWGLIIIKMFLPFFPSGPANTRNIMS